jgi:RNA polymerase sigma factor (TIGR02999 family)
MADEREDPSRAELQAAAELLPALYAELRNLAAALTARLPPGQTLQPTALVHEAYLKMVRDRDPGWEGRRHFFGAAARAMREILIDQARRKASGKHGGHGQRVELSEGLALIEPPADDLLALDDAIQRLQAEVPRLGGGRAAPLLRRAERGGDRRGRWPLGPHHQARVAAGAGLARRALEPRRPARRAGGGP